MEDLNSKKFIFQIQCPEDYSFQTKLPMENSSNKCLQFINKKLCITYEGTLESTLSVISALKNGSNENIKNPTTIFDLSDDCLLELFKYLPLADQLILALCHERFHSIFSRYLRVSRTFTTEIMDPRISDDMYTEIIEEYDEFIETFQITSRDKVYDWTTGQKSLKLFLVECKNLRCLNLDFPYIIYDHLLWQFSIENLINLNKLIVKNNLLTDKDLNILSRIENLDYLDISNNTQIRGGKYFKKFKNLTVLILYGCCRINSNRFLQISENCKKLLTLDLRVQSNYIQRMKPSDYYRMFENLSGLECLGICNQSISYRSGVDRLLGATLKNLKYLLYFTKYCYYDTNTTSNQFGFLQCIAGQLIGFKIEFRYFESLTDDFNSQLEGMINLKEFHLGGPGFDFCNFDWPTNCIRFPRTIEKFQMSVYTDQFCFQPKCKRTQDFFNYLVSKQNYFDKISLKCLNYNEEFLFRLLDIVQKKQGTFLHKIKFECSLSSKQRRCLNMHPNFKANKNLIEFVAKDFFSAYAEDKVAIDNVWQH